jgi:hypothetical protein
VHARSDGALVFAVYPADFPTSTRPVLVIEDLAAPGTFGSLGNVFVAGTAGLQVVTLGDADADKQVQLTRALALLRTDALTAFDLRAALPTADASHEAFDKVTAKKKASSRLLDSQHDSVQAIVDLAKRLKGGGSAVRLADVETVIPAVPASAAAVAASAPASR